MTIHYLRNKLSHIALAAAAVALFGAASSADIARADGWPQSVQGTNWSMRANQSTTTLFVAFQSGVGNCQTINGTVFNVAMEGFYCPFSGRIGFVRKATAFQTSAPTQYFEGQLSQDAGSDFIAGTMTVWTQGAQPGLYNFTAQRP
jgi:hypothetical protein